jgi:hypothetical protein
MRKLLFIPLLMLGACLMPRVAEDVVQGEETVAKEVILDLFPAKKAPPMKPSVLLKP